MTKRKLETVTRYTVDREPITTYVKRADAKARADELNEQNADAYREAVAELEGQERRAAELLGRDVADVTVALPAPPAEAKVVDVERVVGYQVEAVEPAPELDGGERRVLLGAPVLDKQAAEGELERLEHEGASPHWRGPEHRFEVVERDLIVDEGEALLEAHAAALELERKAAAKAAR